MGARPISVVERGEEWALHTANEGILGARATKRGAVDLAKDRVQDEAQFTHVVIHDSHGSVQRGWWPPSNRILRVQPLGGDLADRYADTVREFEGEGFERPYWRVEKRKDGQWSLWEISPTRDQAIDYARDVWDRDYVKRLSIYGPDWYKEDELTHEI